MTQIAVAIALLCGGLAAAGLLYLLFRQEPERKPEGPRERAPEHHAPEVPQWTVNLDTSKLSDLYALNDGPIGHYTLPDDVFAQPAKAAKPRKPEYRYRSAITGKFVKASYAKRYPHRTVRSKVKS